MEKIAVVGAGLIGRAWTIVFARAGFFVSLHDRSSEATANALGFIAARLPELKEHGLLADTPKEVMARISLASTLEAALENAAFVQENGPEQLETKAALFSRMDEIAPASSILSSSTSGIPPSAFTRGLRGRHRCVVAHPVNPPYLIPVVEICPAPWTTEETLDQTRALMERAGMVPATIKKEVQGFVLNRLQIALVAEAFRLVKGGVVSPEDLDATIKHGLGLRWAFMGPFETIDLNAPGGVADYCARYGQLYGDVEADHVPIKFTSELVKRVEKARRAELPLESHPARQEWRDRRLMALLALKKGKAG